MPLSAAALPLPTLERIAAVLAVHDEQIIELTHRLDWRPPPRKVPPGWATLKHASEMSGFSYECVRQWALTNKIVAQRQGARWIVRLDSVRKRTAR